MIILPANYNTLTPSQKIEVREQYRVIQNNVCMYCKGNLFNDPPKKIKLKKVNWKLFPANFRKYPIHLQHNHKTGMTEGAVHSYCNAVMWQYEGR